MTHGEFNSGEHERLKELAAAATCGVLSAEETEILESHLRHCEECHAAFCEFQVLTNEGIAMLAASYEHHEEIGGWNERAARRKLLLNVQQTSRVSSIAPVSPVWPRPARRLGWVAALAACLLMGVGIGALQFGDRQSRPTVSATRSIDDRMAEMLSARKTAESALAAQIANLSRIQQEDTAKRRELAELQVRFHALQKQQNVEHASAEAESETLNQARAIVQTQLNQVALQRDELSEQLRSIRQAYDRAEAELVSLRAERDKSRLQLASLETRISELTVFNQEQEGRLKSNERFLASDRDIRDLMSARNLYIADVFDVDSHSRTRRPFGRVFFTRGKSLLFYAFDLDQQPQLKNANTFQVWGQRETDQNEPARPVDLGILYLDSEANRRWFMRFDNPQTLSEIDAVFVTVEPHGGSRKPTGKPFLFATLRREANHP